MKLKSALAMAVVASSLFAAQSAFASEKVVDLDQSLVAHYSFEKSLEDRSAGGHGGTIGGAALSYADGVKGKSVTFSGAYDSYAQLPRFTEDFSGGMTISVWASFDANSGSWARILDLGNGAGSDNILLARDGYSSKLCFEVYSPLSKKNINTQKVEVKDGIQFGKLNHIVVRAKPVDGVFVTEFYINGVKQETVDYNGYANNSTNIPRKVDRNYAFLAKSNWGIDGMFKGVQDELRVYNRYLNDDELQALTDFKAPVTKYHFDPIQASTKGGVSYIQGFKLSLQGEDEGAGVKDIRYRVNGGEWTTYTGSFDIFASDTNKVEYYSKDYAGNDEESVNTMDFEEGTFTGAGSY